MLLVPPTIRNFDSECDFSDKSKDSAKYFLHIKQKKEPDKSLFVQLDMTKSEVESDIFCYRLKFHCKINHMLNTN